MLAKELGKQKNKTRKQFYKTAKPCLILNVIKNAIDLVSNFPELLFDISGNGNRG
jgi:hypothetical protein